MQKIISFILALALPLAVGFGASKLFGESAQVYNTFVLPPFAPPAYLFGIVWTFIYVLMGLASYLIFQADVVKNQKNKALMLYASQLVVNFFWTYFFFNLGWMFFAFLWILFLISLVLLCMHSFKKISKWAFLLFIPYLLWSTFAAYLNLSLYILNG